MQGAIPVKPAGSLEWNLSPAEFERTVQEPPARPKWKPPVRSAQR
jgi:hypothetical protein